MEKVLVENELFNPFHDHVKHLQGPPETDMSGWGNATADAVS